MNIKWLIFFLSLFLVPVFMVKAKIGLVLTHGTGDYTNKPEAAIEVYWTQEFVDALERPGRPLLVTYCNFDTYMNENEASGCLAKQIVQFIDKYNLTEVRIITHSYGGVVLRYILSQPHRSHDFKMVVQNTKQVIAISPSNAGTVVADRATSGSWVEKEFAEFFGFATNAVEQQTTWSMKYANRVLLKGTLGRPPLPVPYQYVYGSSVTANIFAGAQAFCGGYNFSVALSLISWLLPKCSDGMLSCHSQSFAGVKLFKDTEKTESGHYLNHHQSRRNCFGLTNILNAELIESG